MWDSSPPHFSRDRGATTPSSLIAHQRLSDLVTSRQVGPSSGTRTQIRWCLKPVRLPLRQGRMVAQEGLEPSRLAALVSKTSVAAITPPGDGPFGRHRTFDLRVKSALLLPTELRRDGTKNCQGALALSPGRADDLLQGSFQPPRSVVSKSWLLSA